MWNTYCLHLASCSTTQWHHPTPTMGSGIGKKEGNLKVEMKTDLMKLKNQNIITSTNVKYTKLYLAHVVVTNGTLPAVNAGCQALQAPQLQRKCHGHSKQDSQPQEQNNNRQDHPGMAAIGRKDCPQ